MTGKPKGWRNESHRHALAARGISTGSPQTSFPDDYEMMEFQLHLSRAANDYIRSRYEDFVFVMEDGQVPESMEFRDWILSDVYTFGESGVIKHLDPQHLEGKCSSCVHRMARSAMLNEFIRMGLWTHEDIVRMNDLWNWDYDPVVSVQNVSLREHRYR